MGGRLKVRSTGLGAYCVDHARSRISISLHADIVAFMKQKSKPATHKLSSLDEVVAFRDAHPNCLFVYALPNSDGNAAHALLMTIMRYILLISVLSPQLC